jgi:hypothetical protein
MDVKAVSAGAWAIQTVFEEREQLTAKSSVKNIRNEILMVTFPFQIVIISPGGKRLSC